MIISSLLPFGGGVDSEDTTFCRCVRTGNNHVTPLSEGNN
jgi:hypothetical protein